MQTSTKRTLLLTAVVVAAVGSCAIGNIREDAARRRTDAANADLALKAAKAERDRRAALEAAKSPEQKASEAATRAELERKQSAAVAAEEQRLRAHEASKVKLRPAYAKLEWWDACAAWGREARGGQSSQLKAEVIRERIDSLLNAEDLGGTIRKRVTPGMTTCGVYAAIGRPETINRSTYSFGSRAQLVYRGRGMYVYTDHKPDDGNGVVTSVQD